MIQNEPTPTVELVSIPKILKNANAIAGAAAMIAPPMIDSLPVSTSPRRMAKPPAMMAAIPRTNPKSMITARLLEMPVLSWVDEKVVPWAWRPRLNRGTANTASAVKDSARWRENGE